MLTGKPITGAQYIREKHGPVPKPIMPVRQELNDEGAVRIWKDRNCSDEQTRFNALRQPDMHGFSADELKTVDYWIDHVARDHTAASISDMSHDHAWEIARMGEEIPYHALFTTRIREPSTKERDRIAARVKELGLP
jgi:hypothetical protein